MQKTKVLFFSPSFSRGGSEMYLYHLLNTIDRNKFEIELFVDGAGELTKEKLPYPVYVTNKDNSFLKNTTNPILKKVTGRHPNKKRIEQIHKKFKPDIWYFNTSVISEYMNYANSLNIPYVIHFHELYSVFDTIYDNDFAGIIRKAKAIIACSVSVQKMIQNVRTEGVFVQYEHIKSERIAKSKSMKEKYGIPKDSFVWLMSGQKNYRKGYDLAPQIVEFLKKHNAYLIWLGSTRNYWINQLVGAKEYDNFIEPGLLRGNEYNEIWNMVDGFVLTSREDPFPLVMIEAASKKVPIVSFNSGGVSEFIEDGMGKIVEANNLPSLLEGMQQLMEGELEVSPEKLEEKASNFDVRVKAMEWQLLIQKILS